MANIVLILILASLVLIATFIISSLMQQQTRTRTRRPRQGTTQTSTKTLSETTTATSISPYYYAFILVDGQAAPTVTNQLDWSGSTATWFGLETSDNVNWKVLSTGFWMTDAETVITPDIVENTDYGLLFTSVNGTVGYGY
jgi:hypothetical protein